MLFLIGILHPYECPYRGAHDEFLLLTEYFVQDQKYVAVAHNLLLIRTGCSNAIAPLPPPGVGVPLLLLVGGIHTLVHHDPPSHLIHVVTPSRRYSHGSRRYRPVPSPKVATPNRSPLDIVNVPYWSAHHCC